MSEGSRRREKKQEGQGGKERVEGNSKGERGKRR